MKNKFLFCGLILSSLLSANTYAATLIEVYQQALTNDQIFQQALSQQLMDQENVPISLAGLLPSANIVATPAISRATSSGSGRTFVSSTQRGYDINLTLTQTLFDFAKFSQYAGARANAKQADATMNAAAQDLMVRVAKAYFAILNDEDNLRYTIAAKRAYAKQLDQVNQQFQVGLKTITDVYTAQASYDSSQSDFIAATNALADDKENLRVITNELYPNLAKLSEEFPLISPKPANITEWVETAQRQNWSIKAAQYAAESARQKIKQQQAGHLPTLTAQGNYDVTYTRSTTGKHAVVDNIGAADGSNGLSANGPNNTRTSTGSLVLNIPLVEGGLVLANTRQAQYNYRIATSKLEQQIRNTVNTTRQSYLNIASGISKIHADKQAIISSRSSLDGMQAAYEVGTETLVNVLAQRQKLYNAEKQYANDRYAYVNSLLALKAAAGTLSQDDLVAINSWLRTSVEDEKTLVDDEDKPSKELRQVAKVKVHKKATLVTGKKTKLAKNSTKSRLIAPSKKS